MKFKSIKKIVSVLVISGMLLTACNNSAQVDHNQSAVQSKGESGIPFPPETPKNLFTGSGYYINNYNELYRSGQENCILTDIVRIYDGVGGTFAIDKQGDVWGWECEWLSYDQPQKINGLSGVKAVVSGGQMVSESTTDGFYSVFLLENGDIYIAGRGLDVSDQYQPDFQGFKDSYPVVFEYSTPKKIKYSGKAKDIWPIERGDFAILMENNDLFSVSFKKGRKKIEQTKMIPNCIDLMTLNGFNIAVSEDGYYGWGVVDYRNGDDDFFSHLHIINTPTKLGGMDHILACSNQLVGLKDGSLWLRKDISLMTYVGKQIETVKDVIYIDNTWVMTADGILYSIGTEGDAVMICDTGFHFDYEKSTDTYCLSPDDDFWKYGGYSQ